MDEEWNGEGVKMIEKRISDCEDTQANKSSACHTTMNRHLASLSWDEIKLSEEYASIRFCVIKRALASGHGCFECGSTEHGKLDVAIPNVGNPKNWRRRLDFMAYECVCVDCKREWKRRALLRKRRP